MVTVAFDDEGSGEPALLLIPGWCESRRLFSALIGQLQGRHRVLSMDLPGHGETPPPEGDFGGEEIVSAALSVIERSKAGCVVPVAHSQSGWAAIELLRRPGLALDGLVLLDWVVVEPPPTFATVLEDLQDPLRSTETRDHLLALWAEHGAPAEVLAYLREDLARYGTEMWARAAREIGKAYAAHGSPLHELAALQPRCRVLHLYAQPTDEDYLMAQYAFAEANPWFEVQRLDAGTHFPTIEVPDLVAEAIDQFLRRGTSSSATVIPATNGRRDLVAGRDPSLRSG